MRWFTFYISRRLSWLRGIVLPVLSPTAVPPEMLFLLEFRDFWSTDWSSESDVWSSFLFLCLSSTPLYSSFCNVLGTDMWSPAPGALSIPSSNLPFRLELVPRVILEAKDLTRTESSDTNDRKSFTEGGIFEKNKSLKFPNIPLLYGFSFLSYRYRKFSYVVCNRTDQQDMWKRKKKLEHVKDQINKIMP